MTGPLGDDVKRNSELILTPVSYRSKLPPTATQRERLEELIADGSVWRMREIEAAGITAATVRRAVDQGLLTAVSRGLYRRTGAEPVRGERLAQLVARVPNAVICLLSAAEFHGLGGIHSDEVWGAIPNGGRNPKPDWPPFRAVRWRADEAREIGVEAHEICGVAVRIATAAAPFSSPARFP